MKLSKPESLEEKDLECKDLISIEHHAHHEVSY